jgi:serine phosphatase RsbU (regulator of sigma subunit)
LRKHDRIIGAMQFVNTVGSREFTEDDLALARATASRVASSLENIRLSEGQRTIARTLQASLLPDSLPEVPGVDIGVRYWASGEGTEVGGDFYDVFDVEDGHAIVIGDVCGTGPLAASMTSLARHTIRAAAWQGADHTDVLRQLNNAMLRSGRATFCTVAYATVTQHRGGRRFEFASAGHPLPILVRDGEPPRTIGKPGTLLGAFEGTSSTVTAVELEPGDTIVLHTDGATDVRPPYGLSNEALLDIVAGACSNVASADDVVERIGARLSEVLEVGRRNDDIALLALRVRR